MKLTKDLEQLQLKDNGKQFYCQLIPESSTTTKGTVATGVLLAPGNCRKNII